jgi:hypothetical protein
MMILGWAPIDRVWALNKDPCPSLEQVGPTALRYSEDNMKGYLDIDTRSVLI